MYMFQSESFGKLLSLQLLAHNLLHIQSSGETLDGCYVGAVGELSVYYSLIISLNAHFSNRNGRILLRD